MKIESLSNFWSRIEKTNDGLWVHPDDQELFAAAEHSFNLDYPPPAFVGDIIDAKVIILTANGGYKPKVTPNEFVEFGAEQNYIARLANPSGSDWLAVAQYYSALNYAEMICGGIVATVNACAYRSPEISKEPLNRKLIGNLPSVKFTRSWLLDCVIKYAQRGDKLVIAKRWGLWDLPTTIFSSHGLIKDSAPRLPHLSKATLRSIQDSLN